jgi:hypothetical protein
MATGVNLTTRQRWLGAALLVGVLYLVVGIASGILADRAASDAMRFVWRLSAFVGSAVLLVAHIWYEKYRLRSPVQIAWHASVAGALGGFALALMANVHELGSDAAYRPRMLVAFLAWPLLTGVPAFVVALIVATVLGRTRMKASRG